jgi:hypothetical protein
MRRANEEGRHPSGWSARVVWWQCCHNWGYLLLQALVCTSARQLKGANNGSLNPHQRTDRNSLQTSTPPPTPLEHSIPIQGAVDMHYKPLLN